MVRSKSWLVLLVFCCFGLGIAQARPSDELLGALGRLEQTWEGCGRHMFDMMRIESGRGSEDTLRSQCRALLSKLSAFGPEAVRLRSEFKQQAMLKIDQGSAASSDDSLEFLLSAQAAGLMMQELAFVYRRLAEEKSGVGPLLQSMANDPAGGGFFQTLDQIREPAWQEDFYAEFNLLAHADQRLKRLAKAKEYLQPLYARIRLYASAGGRFDLPAASLRGSLNRSLAFGEGFWKQFSKFEFKISKVFGNVAGALNIQRFLRNISQSELQRLLDEVLQPGDILIEKTPGALTDSFIPGHFGHVAIYIGRPDQLEALRLADGSPFLSHPSAKQHLTTLGSDKTLCESVRSGVQLEDLRHWTVTDLAILRPVALSRQSVAEGLLKTLRYVGTTYDFGFDADSKDMVYCSEMPVHAFPQIPFRLWKKAGRRFNYPDDVAVLAGAAGEADGRPFELVYFNHKCSPISPRKAFKQFRSILDKAGSQYDQILGQ